MPVKVQCDCGAAINAPDAARGKVLKCKQCGSGVRVPGGGPRKKKAAPRRGDVHDEDFFARIDLHDGEDRNVNLCPKCASEVDDEDIECPNCGVNLETGVLSAKQKKKRRNKGPDPDEFFKVAWKDAVAFTKKNVKLGLRLCLAWSSFTMVALFAQFMAFEFCEKVPLQFFWGAIAFMGVCASFGSGVQLLLEILKVSREGKDEVDRFEFDFFVGNALGLKILLWPLAILSPILIPVGVVIAPLLGRGIITIDSSLYLPLGIAGGVLYLLPVVCLPVAVSHLAATYTYKAYLPLEMLKRTWSNLKAVMFTWMLTFLVLTPGVAIVVLSAVFYSRLRTACAELVAKIVEMCGSDPVEGGFMVALIGLVAIPTILWIALFIVSWLAAFPTLIYMRVNARFAHYNSRNLGIGENRKGGQPAGFWPRYLAFELDLVLLGSFLGIKEGMLFGMIKLAEWVMDDSATEVMDPLSDGALMQFFYVARALDLLISLGYFTFTESGPGKGTLGMSTMDLIVVDQNGKSPIERGTAMTRAVGRLVSGLMCGFGFLMSIKDEEQRTLHDKMTKTNVVWFRDSTA
jgi:uncharacterized RDD family membrane protein YckC